MTPKQEERLRKKIANIRKALAADKKFWGEHHDGGGLRYAPPGLFIKLKDYKGGLRYLRWFDRTFPDDACHGAFYFDWALILFKTGNLKEVEPKVFQCLTSNNHLINYFLQEDLFRPVEDDYSDFQKEQLEKLFTYKKTDPELEDFTAWLIRIVKSEKFQKAAEEYLALEEQLQHEDDPEKRSKIISRESELEKNY